MRYALYRGLCGLSMGIITSLCATDNLGQWTWLYTKKFSDEELMRYAAEQKMILGKSGIQKFSQLIFSWNALRPVQGYFTFLVSTRDARTRQWGSWHKMADWGADIQRSYSSKSDGRARYLHVRLETGQLTPADAFRIKVESNDGADLGLVRGISVNVSHSPAFKAEDPRTIALPSVHIKKVPRISQMVLDHPRAHELCSPTASCMLTRYVANLVIDPVDFAHHAFDSGLNVYGSWPFNTAHAFERCDGALFFATTRCNSFAQLHHYLKNDLPVVVSVRGHLEGAPKPYAQGHLLVVVGWDARKKEVICHDPAFHGHHETLVRYSCASFLSAWERSRRLAYVVHPSMMGLPMA